MWNGSQAVIGAVAGQLYRATRNTLNWRLVRSLGELQVLTRTSFIALLLVPLLAGLWPAVRLLVNQHNRAVEEAAVLLEQSADSLERVLNASMLSTNSSGEPGATASSTPPKSQSILQDLETQAAKLILRIESHSEDYGSRTLDTPRLPWSLAAAFFAALAVASAHLLYQALAPEQVRRWSWEDFVLARKEDFKKHQSTETLERARQFSRTIYGRRVRGSEDFENERLLHRLYGCEDEELAQYIQSLSNHDLSSLSEYLHSDRPEGPPQYLNKVKAFVEKQILGEGGRHDTVMAEIERGARAEYLNLASRRAVGVLAAGFLYLIGLALAIQIIYVQATSVLEVAGWNSLADVLRPR